MRVEKMCKDEDCQTMYDFIGFIEKQFADFFSKNIKPYNWQILFAEYLCKKRNETMKFQDIAFVSFYKKKERRLCQN